MRLLVTGGAGFIGSALVRFLLRDTEAAVVNVDKLTYAANPEALESVVDHPRYAFVQADICDREAMRRVLAEYQPQAIMHLAAESHVDRSIDQAADFIQTNILGTYILLESALEYWRDLGEAEREAFRFHHVSTDEVFGALGESGTFSEESPYRPSSPYSASKASADHLARAWHHTYGLPVVMSNCSNNYGPYQFPEKLIPLMIVKALAGEELPVYGKGENVRDWIYVDDHVRGLYAVLTKGRVGETYNLGARCERRNIEVVRAICDLLDELAPQSQGRQCVELISFVHDRPGHDLRYAIDPGKAERELGWRPGESFESGLRKTVQWYLEHRDWWRGVLEQRYAGERLGLGGASTRGVS